MHPFPTHTGCGPADEDGFSPEGFSHPGIQERERVSGEGVP